MKLNTSTAPGAAESEKRPSAPVVLPLVVPFTSTVTPGKGLWSVPDVTMPVTVRAGVARAGGRGVWAWPGAAGTRPNISRNSQ